GCVEDSQISSSSYFKNCLKNQYLLTHHNSQKYCREMAFENHIYAQEHLPSVLTSAKRKMMDGIELCNTMTVEQSVLCCMESIWLLRKLALPADDRCKLLQC